MVGRKGEALKAVREEAAMDIERVLLRKVELNLVVKAGDDSDEKRLVVESAVA